uniref:MADF domain-containing protein n=1 Tax=Anopheles quadriannulatus TaxID=34691 RepID=A0A182X487_ANOQN
MTVSYDLLNSSFFHRSSDSSNEYLDDPLIEFVKVEGNDDSDNQFVDDTEIEDPNLLSRPKKIRKIICYQTDNRKVVHPKHVAKRHVGMAAMPVLQKTGIRKIPTENRNPHIKQMARNHDATPTKLVAQNYENRKMVKHLTDEVRRKKMIIEAHQTNMEEKKFKKNMIPMSEMKTIALIRRIEKEPSIWDKKHEGYRSKANKDKAWSRVVGKTGIPLEIVKAKWSSVLGSFRHYKALHQKDRDNGYQPDAIEDTSVAEYIDDPRASEEHYESEHMEEEEYLLQNETRSPNKRTPMKEDAVDSTCSDDSNSAEILRIVRSMSKVLDKMANVGMPVDYGRYVNQHLKEYDEAIRRKTVKGIMDLIAAANAEMANKYPERKICKT